MYYLLNNPALYQVWKHYTQTILVLFTNNKDFFVNVWMIFKLSTDYLTNSDYFL